MTKLIKELNKSVMKKQLVNYYLILIWLKRALKMLNVIFFERKNICKLQKFIFNIGSYLN